MENKKLNLIRLKYCYGTLCLAATLGIICRVSYQAIAEDGSDPETRPKRIDIGFKFTQIRLINGMMLFWSLLGILLTGLAGTCLLLSQTHQ